MSDHPWQQPDAPSGSAKKGGKRGQGSGTPLYKWPFELAQGFTGLLRSRLRGEPVRVAFEAPDSILNGRITNARRVATQQLDLSRVKEIGRRSDASVNDIFHVGHIIMQMMVGLPGCGGSGSVELVEGFGYVDGDVL